MNYRVPSTIAAFALCAGVLTTMIPTLSGGQGKDRDAATPVTIQAPLPLPVTEAPALTARALGRMLLGPTEYCQGRNMATVHPTRQMVIEHVSALFTLPVGQQVTVAILRIETPSGYRVLDVLEPKMLGQIDATLLPFLLPPVSITDRAQFYAVDHNTKVYLNGGEVVSFLWCRDTAAREAFAEVELSGFIQVQTP
jgi:hypothetical protein